MRALTAYPALLCAYWERAVAYRAVFVVALLNAAFPLVMMAIWIGMAQTGPVAGYTAVDFASYYLSAVLVRRITSVGIVSDVERLVRTGELSVYLIRPLGVIHHFLLACWPAGHWPQQCRLCSWPWRRRSPLASSSTCAC